MNYILIIKGVTDLEYQSIKADLIEQYEAKSMEVPIFAMLPQDYPDIEVLWIDEAIEKENYKQIVESIGHKAKLMGMINN